MTDTYTSSYSGVFDEVALTYFSVYAIAMAVLSIVGMWKMFSKAGVPGWIAIIPFVNIVYLTKIALGNGWLCLLLFVPFVNFFFPIYMNWQLGKSFGKGVGFRIGLIFLSGLFCIILGFDNSKYIGPCGNSTPSDRAGYKITEM